MAPQQKRTTVYTIGHSNIPLDDFIRLLQHHDIALLMDVRSAPHSRFSPHFNRKKLGDTLATCGIGYTFAGEWLGGRPKDPTCYKNGRLPEGKTDYLHVVDYAAVAQRPWFMSGIQRLIALADQQRTAIMCSEKDPQRCHRHHLIAKTLLQRDIQVLHILHQPLGTTIDAASLVEEERQSQNAQQGSLWD